MPAAWSHFTQGMPTQVGEIHDEAWEARENTVTEDIYYLSCFKWIVLNKTTLVILHTTNMHYFGRGP